MSRHLINITLLANEKGGRGFLFSHHVPGPLLQRRGRRGTSAVSPGHSFSFQAHLWSHGTLGCGVNLPSQDCVAEVAAGTSAAVLGVVKNSWDVSFQRWPAELLGGAGSVSPLCMRMFQGGFP